MDDKQKKIAVERKILLKLLGLNPQKKVDSSLEEVLIRRTVNDLAFMRVELDGLQKRIMLEGWQDDYQNGANQGGTKNTPSAKAYLDVQKLYNATVRHLKSLAAGTEIATDSLMDFLQK